MMAIMMIYGNKPTLLVTNIIVAFCLMENVPTKVIFILVTINLMADCSKHSFLIQRCCMLHICVVIWVKSGTNVLNRLIFVPSSVIIKSYLLLPTNIYWLS